MSRIIDVVNKIMQISGEMNTFKILSAFIEVSKGKNVSFSKFTTGNLWESKRTRSLNNSYLARACHSSLFLLEDCVD